MVLMLVGRTCSHSSPRSLAAYCNGVRSAAARPGVMTSRGLASGSGELVKVKSGAGFRVLSLDRPKALHAINLPMVQRIQQKMDRWAELDIVDVVVLRSTGDRAFCAGGDIAQLYKDAKEPETRSKAMEFFKHEYSLNFSLGMYPKPILAMIKGITMGGGVGLSIHGSIRVACPSTVFAMPETNIGFFPDVGAGKFLLHCFFFVVQSFGRGWHSLAQ
jgi:enoyl-CoA hydratase/carnithine racemase